MIQVRRAKKGRPVPKPDIKGLPLQKLRRLPLAAGPVHVSCFDYGPDRQEMTSVLDMDAFLAQHRPPWAVVRWINVDGLSDMKILEALAKKYDLHPLAIEDVLHQPQRPKVDYYGGAGSGGEHQARLFIVARMVELKDDRLEQDQIIFFRRNR